MASLDNVKVLLKIPDGDQTKDGLINLYLQRARDYVCTTCKMDETEIPPALNSVIEDMAIFQYRGNGVENVQSEGKGSTSETYLLEYPPNIMNRLNPHSQVKFI